MNSIDEITGSCRAVLTYFYSSTCAVCRDMRPKVRALINERFPRLVYLEVNASEEENLTASASVFSAPTLIVWLDGKEYIRAGKYVSITELEEKISRYYDLFFDDQ